MGDLHSELTREAGRSLAAFIDRTIKVLIDAGVPIHEITIFQRPDEPMATYVGRRGMPFDMCAKFTIKYSG